VWKAKKECLPSLQNCQNTKDTGISENWKINKRITKLKEKQIYNYMADNKMNKLCMWQNDEENS